MEPGHHLKNLLQIQLATDPSAVRYLPYCLSTLTTECLQPSSHLVKWTTRIHSLLHSKEPGGRWAGLCLAYKSSILSQSLMIDSAQSWIGVALPLFSRNEPLPTIKAAIRLMRVIFSTAIDVSEYHRQVSLPCIVMFTSALIPLADNHSDVELKVLCMETLTRLIPLYPTTHRVSSPALSAFALRYLSGSITGPTNKIIIHAASQLYAVLPLIGGKVGSVNLWRKSMDETLAFGWEAFFSLRTTFPIEGQNTRSSPRFDEPQVAVPVNQDRLNCSVIILCDLLSTIVQRPVQIPIGNLVKFITALLNSSPDGQVDGFVDPSIRAMEVSTVPDIWTAGCGLLKCLALEFPHRLDAHSGRLATLLAYRLERMQSAFRRVVFLNALDALLKGCHASDSLILPTRLAKTILPSLVKILNTTSKEISGAQEPSSSKSKNGKKRARNFEGDEVFSMSREVLYPTGVDGEVLLKSIDILQSLFRNPNLSSSVRSIVARIVISILITLPRTSPSSLSNDPRLFELVNIKIEKFSILIGHGTTSVMSKTLPFVIQAAMDSHHREIQDDIEKLLHSRLPPLLRSMPHVESLSLFRAEESQEEIEALVALKVEGRDLHQDETMHSDAIMSEHTSTVTVLPVIHAPTPQVEDKVLKTVLAPSLHPKSSNETLDDDATLTIRKEVEFEVDVSPRPTAVAISDKETIHLPTSYVPVEFSEQMDQDEDDEEEMPTINMASDSEEEDLEYA